MMKQILQTMQLAMRDNKSHYCNIITADGKDYIVREILKVDKEIVIINSGGLSLDQKIIICNINSITRIELNKSYYNEALIDKILKLMPDLAPFM